MNDSPHVVIRFLRVLVVLAVAAGAAYLLFELKEAPEQKEVAKIPPSVTVMTVSPRDETMSVAEFGTVVARRQVRIAAEITGRIIYLNPAFKAGSFIREKDLLIKIDPRPYMLDQRAAKVRVTQARLDLERAELDIENLKKDREIATKNLELAAKEMDRIAQLSRQQFASETSLEKVKQQHLAARSQLQGIENHLSLAGTLIAQKEAALAMAGVDYDRSELAFEKTRISAPFGGYVLQKQTERGEYVNPGQALGLIYEKGALDVDVHIPMEKIKWIAAFFKNGRMPRAQVSLASDNGLGPLEWPARVVRVGARLDETTRTLPMTLEIDMPPSDTHRVFELKPGTFVSCTIEGQTYPDIFVLPRYLLKTGDVLFTVRNGRLNKAPVGVLRKVGDAVYINRGLSPGDQVITSPLPGAVDGMALTIKHNGDD